MTYDLSEFAIRLAHHIAHVSEKGLRDPIEWAIVAECFSPADREHMVEAAFELKQAGLLRVAGAMNVPDGISHVRAEYELYWYFDRDVFNYDINADVATLIRLILEDERRGDAATLIACTNMTPRRFNPAFARIVEEIPEGRVRKSLQPDYCVAGILITPEDRVSLKTLKKGIEDHFSSMAENQSPSGKPASTAPGGEVTVGPSYFNVKLPIPTWLAWTILSIILVIGGVAVWAYVQDRFSVGFAYSRPTLSYPSNAVTLSNFPRLWNCPGNRSTGRDDTSSKFRRKT